MALIITIGGTVLTAIGTVVTLWQASKVKAYRDQIAFDLRKIHLSEVGELLRRAQDEGRKLLSQVQQLNRGKSMISIADDIQSYIDKSLNLLHLNGPDTDIRNQIIASQEKLRNFQSTHDVSKKRRFVSDMHTLIQDSISMCKERISNLEYGDKND
ncbi:hypothetical protein QWY20_08065 [Alkalimonas sp. MEB108]|uniref:Uncharacterized protein n=1 Tax=Alkalimonas cellulosilytica TaxID=3058395 RepID=A0ABU7J4H8_9GAMM|nr:hypothetical protein [Alkalimonas sp. MEB108]MEE2001406.1 hypothetical protein [Alkalimonas sp. MEB108]